MRGLSLYSLNKKLESYFLQNIFSMNSPEKMLTMGHKANGYWQDSIKKMQVRAAKVH